MRLMLSLCVALGGCLHTMANDVVIIQAGRPRAAIYVPERILKDAAAEPASIWRNGTPEANQRRLRESVQDFAGILERISGGKIAIRSGRPDANAKELPILVGELAAERFGKPQKTYPFRQGFRVVATDDAIGIAGESDLATSYGLYTLLDQLGCRWYLPSPLGEVLPQSKTVAFAKQDHSTGPYTTYRGLWYIDNDFARRNRLGGMELSAGHALEGTVPRELREKHPEVRAIINGKPDDRKVKWTHPLVAKAIADVHVARLQKDPNIRSFSLSPDDGIGWDESADAKHDSGDFDPAVQMISKTDRLMVLANRVAEQVTAKHPDVLFGVLAYADYTRPPLREKLHPNVVPQIAPITFSRAQPMTDDGEPNNKSLRYLIEGWGKAAKKVSYYFYGFYLAEPSSPNPYIGKWSTDIPIIYRNNCMFWQPETITNFETTMHAHYLGLRMAWDPRQEPKSIIEELHKNFYGQAAQPMAEYWHYIDHLWTDTPEYAGCGFGHLRRFTPERMAKARKLMDAALAAALTPSPSPPGGEGKGVRGEKARVQMADDSLRQFELFMKLRYNLAEGRFADLGKDSKQYRDNVVKLCDKYEKQYAFGRMGWTRQDSIYGRYFQAFYQKTYEDAARIAGEYDILTEPLRQWRIRTDKDQKGEAAGWGAATFDDTGWDKTDVPVDTWSRLGLHNYMGSAWYRTTVKLPKVADGKKHQLWIGATDGRVKVFVNGRHVPYVDAKGTQADTFSGYCRPASFDVTSMLSAGDNTIALLCTREFLNELGTGGLLAPPVIYRDR